MATLKQKQVSVLTMNTLAFAVNFAVWVMLDVYKRQIPGCWRLAGATTIHASRAPPVLY